VSFEITLDCADPERLGDFWAEALRYRKVGGLGQYVLLAPEDPGAPNVILQRVPEPKTVKNRMHLDLKAADIEAEAARLEAIGAKRLDAAPFEEHGGAWIRMLDPEGNEFCVCRE
jgi:predicted enzyme related to lactoylglutathione lyase